ncbi:MAG: ROK family transcriptional regulator [Actinomycetota bacterium]|nr:ROK family transcriptional regulator [Actinomycetota bacterium]
MVALLGQAGPLTQGELATGTGLSRTTVLNVVRDLLADMEVTLRPALRGGRRVKEVTLTRRATLVLGVDFGHRHVRVALADPAELVVAETFERLPDGHAWDDDAVIVGRLVSELHARAGTDPGVIASVGLGLPAPIDPATGEVGSSSILPGWVGVPAAEAIGSVLGVPTFVENDANLGALAERRWGAARGCDDFLYVKLSTGIGAGLVLGGELYRGFAGTAGEIGHISVGEGGHICVCGNRGCLETVAGGRSVLSLLAPLFGPTLTLKGAVGLAVEGDPRAQRAIADAGRTVGFAIANVCNLLAPQRVVFGGDLAGAGEVVLEPIREVVRRHATRPAAAVDVVAGTLGDRAELLGALVVARLAADRQLAERAGGAPLGNILQTEPAAYLRAPPISAQTLAPVAAPPADVGVPGVPVGPAPGPAPVVAAEDVVVARTGT